MLAAPAAAARPGLAIGTPPGEPWAIGPVTPPRNAPSSASAFNPAIGVVLDGRFSAFSQNPDRYFVKGFVRGDETGPGVRGFSLGESEINFSATVDPYFFGNLTLALSPENEVAVEEAFLQTTSLPWGFTLRGGRFFSGIGYINEQHAHTWDFADQALPYRVFLNTQYGDDGVQLRWLAPTRQFLEFGGELFRGAAFPAAGAANSGIGSHSLFAHTGGDIDENSSYRTGVSWLRTKAVDRENAGCCASRGTQFHRQGRHADLRRGLQMGAERQPGRHQPEAAGRVLRAQRTGIVRPSATHPRPRLCRMADRLLYAGDLSVHAALAGRGCATTRSTATTERGVRRHQARQRRA